MQFGFRSVAADGISHGWILKAALQLRFIQSSVDANSDGTLATQTVLFGVERIVNGPKSVLVFCTACHSSAAFSLGVIWEW